MQQVQPGEDLVEILDFPGLTVVVRPGPGVSAAVQGCTENQLYLPVVHAAKCRGVMQDTRCVCVQCPAPHAAVCCRAIDASQMVMEILQLKCLSS